MKMKGILTNCVTNEEKEVELEYKIKMRDSNDVTGWKSFYIDSEYSDIEGMKKSGRLACVGTSIRYDKLFVPAKKMKKALDEIEKTPKSTIMIEKQRNLKNLKDQRKSIQKSLNELDIDIEKIEKELGDKYGHTQFYKK